ncbi:MAG: hypothetical protein ACOCRX_03315 [Candidatus Woesearchaeota archaeon]
MEEIKPGEIVKINDKYYHIGPRVNDREYNLYTYVREDIFLTKKEIEEKINQKNNYKIKGV